MKAWRRADIIVQLLGVSVVAWAAFAGPWQAQPCGQYTAYLLYLAAVVVLLHLMHDLQVTLWRG